MKWILILALTVITLSGLYSLASDLQFGGYLIEENPDVHFVGNDY